MERNSVFVMYALDVFKKWVGFQAAIDEGMGGPYAREKEVWMASEIENYFKRYDNVSPEDIEAYLGAMMENEFETYFEDGSLMDVSKSFCKAFELSLRDPQAEMFREVLQTRNTSAPEVSSKEALNPVMVQNKSVVEEMKHLSVKDDASDDGWVKVERKGKKK